MVHEPDDVEKRTKLFVRDLGLAKFGGKLFDLKSSKILVDNGRLALILGVL